PAYPPPSASCSRTHLHSPPFPTRRSSDLLLAAEAVYYRALCLTAGDGETAELDAAQALLDEWAAHGPALFGAKALLVAVPGGQADRKSTRLNSSHEWISYAVFCLKKKKKQ